MVKSCNAESYKKMQDFAIFLSVFCHFETIFKNTVEENLN